MHIFFEKKKVYVKAKLRGVETEWCRLGDVTKGMETILPGPEAILQIWRLGCHFLRSSWRLCCS